ncbi:MAG: serine hydrolase, partial [Candidatus Helarchaeota archaeon]|nr:serine hydrolase [Candidatus Helarchaeota archaeon]
YKSRVKIRNLLSHSAGLPSWEPLYEISNNKIDLLKNLYKVLLEYIPETDCDYSDLGFILLGEIIERITLSPLDKFCKNYIFKPLKMDKTYFRPPRRMKKDITPTEHCLWRGRIIQGEVHDENAYIMGGVSGHAGLFSNASDIAIFCQMILNGGTYNGVKLINSDTISEFVKRMENINQCKWALGWRVFMGENDILGSFFSERSFGHLGYTGTSIWIDPERKLFTILLTNRVHPTRENKKISDFRPVLHDEIVKYIRV